MNDELKQYLETRVSLLATKDDLKELASKADLDGAIESLAVMVQKGFSSLEHRMSISERATSLALTALESRVRTLEEHASEH